MIWVGQLTAQDMPLLRGLVIARGRWVVYHVPRLERAAVAQLAGRHGLRVVIGADGSAEFTL